MDTTKLTQLSKCAAKPSNAEKVGFEGVDCLKQGLI
jgi:hypothetical protein